MVWLILGVLLWAVVHLSVSLARGLRQRLIAAMGEGPYKGVFSLAMLASIVLMVIGWRAAGPEFVYEPPAWGALAAAPLMLIAIILAAVAQGKSNIRRFLRHPQLTGVVVWGVAHLLANGDLRSIVLFGGLAVWALIEIPIINARAGAWEKPPKSPIMADIRPIVISIVLYAVLVFAHPYLFGVSPIPG